MGKIHDRFKSRQLTIAGRAVATKKVVETFGRTVPAPPLEVHRERALANKGRFGHKCNRTACPERPAVWWNPAMHAFYCRSCAMDMNPWFIRDSMAPLHDDKYRDLINMASQANTAAEALNLITDALGLPPEEPGEWDTEDLAVRRRQVRFFFDTRCHRLP